MKATETLRNQVREYIEKADGKMLKKMQAVIEQDRDEDWWDELPFDMQQLLERAIKEGENGKGVPHEEIVERYAKWFKNNPRWA